MRFASVMAEAKILLDPGSEVEWRRAPALIEIQTGWPGIAISPCGPGLFNRVAAVSSVDTAIAMSPFLSGKNEIFFSGVLPLTRHR